MASATNTPRRAVRSSATRAAARPAKPALTITRSGQSPLPLRSGSTGALITPDRMSYLGWQGWHLALMAILYFSTDVPIEPPPIPDRGG